MEAKSLSRSTVLRWKAGDREAGDVVIAQFEGMITLLCLQSMEIKAKTKYGVWVDRDLLEDLKQECRILIMHDRVRQKYDFRRGELSTFLTWELRSLLSSLKRTRARQPRKPDQLSTFQELPVLVDYLDESSDVNLRIDQLLETLPAERAFLLKARFGFYGRDYKQEEIATFLGKRRSWASKYERLSLERLRTSPIAQSLYEDLVADIL